MPDSNAAVVLSTKPGETLGQFLTHVENSIRDEMFVRLVISNPIKSSERARKVFLRLVSLKSGLCLSIVKRCEDRDLTSNQPVPGALRWLEGQLGTGYRSALLCTTRADWQWSLPADKPASLIRHKPSSHEVPQKSHDQLRERLIAPPESPWLVELGVASPDGRPRERMASKLKQIERYTEILSHIGREENWGETEEWTVGDFGCGKGYLTFAAWSCFSQVLKRKVSVVGVEQRADLVAASNTLASKLGAASLRFVQGTIQDCSLPRLDAVVALHACDVATDHAIGRGLEAGARWILLAPCCQKELRKQLHHPDALAPLLRHGILEERLAEWLTDGLRALYLEWAGYRTKVFEFVDAEHTSKNIMISAVRMHEPFSNPAIAEQIQKLKQDFRLGTLALDRWAPLP